MSNDSFIKQLAKQPTKVREALAYVPLKYRDIVATDLDNFAKVVDKVDYYIEHMIGITTDHPRYAEIYAQRINKAIIQAYPDDNT